MVRKVRVRIFKRTGRKYYEAQWSDLATELKKTRSLRTRSRERAKQLARQLQRDLNSGRLRDPAQTTWAELRQEYETHVMPQNALKSRLKTTTSLNGIQRIIRPRLVRDIDTMEVLRFTSALREKGLSEHTVKGYLTDLRKVLRWGTRVGMVAVMPNIEMPKRLHSMKGRPITPEEFERILAAVPQVVTPERTAATLRRMSKLERGAYEDQRTRTVESWRFLLTGLWWSGLRLGESMALSWDASSFCVDLSGTYPMFRIEAKAEKGRKDRILPMSPEFAQLLTGVPADKRQGFVFNPQPIERPAYGRPRSDWVCKIIRRIGNAAGVQVAERMKKVGRKERTVIKYASAHDLRRAFGLRWAMRVLPAVLMELMRHEDIQTTMKFYVGRNAEVAAKEVWRAAGLAWSPDPSTPIADPLREAA